MILTYAIVVGFLVGISIHKLFGKPYQLPKIKSIELVFIAVLPQIVIFQLNFTRTLFSDRFASITLIISQLILVVFCFINFRQPAFWLLTAGLILNLIVIVTNGGFMPISPKNVTWLIPNITDAAGLVGKRLGFGKDIVLLENQTKLLLLSDYFRFDFLNQKFMYSVGDVILAIGAFWYMLALKTELLTMPGLMEKNNV
jgi:hypothetical protein